jgi:hypothetical protein
MFRGHAPGPRLSRPCSGWRPHFAWRWAESLIVCGLCIARAQVVHRGRNAVARFRSTSVPTLAVSQGPGPATGRRTGPGGLDDGVDESAGLRQRGRTDRVADRLFDVASVEAAGGEVGARITAELDADDRVERAVRDRHG